MLGVALGCIQNFGLDRHELAGSLLETSPASLARRGRDRVARSPLVAGPLQDPTSEEEQQSIVECAVALASQRADRFTKGSGRSSRDLESKHDALCLRLLCRSSSRTVLCRAARDRESLTIFELLCRRLTRFRDDDRDSKRNRAETA
jgi:hypothetical protein